MKRTTSLKASAACLLLALAAAAPAAAAKDAWTSVRTKNFHLVGNASEKDIRQVATRLEQFRFIFAKLFPRANMATTVPTTVVVFKNDSAYTPFKPLYNGKPEAAVAGYFVAGQDVNYITLTAERREGSNPYATIFHEYAHLIINNNMADPPLWFNEGLAEYYSTFDVSEGDKRITLGKPVSSHVYLLRQRFIPLADLFRVTHDSPAYNERDKQGVFYAESWALVHYLLQGNQGQRVAQLGRFSALLGRGRPVEESFREVFQMDFKAMEKELQTYVRNNSYRGQVFDAEKPIVFDTEMQAAPLSEAEAHAYLGDLLLHTRRLDDAEARLKQALALAPDLPMARASLGMLRVRQERFAEAEEELKRAVAASPQSFLAHYYYAYAVSRARLGGAGGGGAYYPFEASRTMRDELKQSVALNPSFVEAYYLLGYVAEVTGQELDEAARLIEQARRLAPNRHDLGLLLAGIHLRRQDFAAAALLLEPLANNPTADPSTRGNARSTLEMVRRIEEQIAKYGKDSVRFTSGSGQTPGAAGEGGATGEPPAVVVDAKPTIKRRAEGEHVRGTLSRIECLSGTSAVVHVNVGGRALRLYAASLDRVEFVSYVPGQAGASIGCGPQKPESLVFVNFRRATGPNAKHDGELLALDFVTPDIELEP